MNNEELRLNVNGDALFVTVDRAEGRALGTVVVVPPFGMSAERLFSTAFQLTRNGFDVYRIDPRNHPGRSTGSIEAFTLSELADDVRTVLDAVPQALVIGISVSSRAVIRALTDRLDWRGAVLITPVVNVSSTLNEVFGADLFKRFHSGGDYPKRNRILGYDVDMTFVADCVAHGMVTTDDAIADLSRCHHPMHLIAGTDDPWVDIHEVRHAAREASNNDRMIEVITVQAATHQLYRNPVLGMTFFHAAVRECLQLVGGNPGDAVMPAFTDIISAVY